MKSAVMGFLAGVLVTVLTLIWFAHSRLVVRTAEGWRVVPKVSGDFHRIYVDVRQWGILEYTRNRDVSEALARDGWAQAKDAMKDAAAQATQALEEAGAKLKETLSSGE
jgi:hypothetical protein